MKHLKAAAFLLIFSVTACALGAAAQEDRTGELEKKLEAVRAELAGEIAALKEAQKTLPKGAPLVSSFSQKANFTGVIQARYDQVQRGVTPAGAAVPRAGAFAVDRVRFKVEGGLDARTTYRFQLEVKQKTQFQLIDAWAAYNLYGSYVNLKAGQALPNSNGIGDPTAWQFLDISNSSCTLAPEGRDRGLFLGGTLAAKKLTYELTMLNGNGIAATAHDDSAFRYGLMVKYEPLGPVSMYMNDIERSSFTAGASLTAAHERAGDAKTGHQARDWQIANVYTKWRGFYGKVTGARQEVDKTAGLAKDQVYFSAQAGYALPALPGHMVEPALRYQVTDVNRSAGDKKEVWTTFGVNYYLRGNSAKLQLNYVNKREQGAASVGNNAYQAGFTLIF